MTRPMGWPRVAGTAPLPNIVYHVLIWDGDREVWECKECDFTTDTDTVANLHAMNPRRLGE